MTFSDLAHVKSMSYQEANTGQRTARKQRQPLPHTACFGQDLSSSPTTLITVNTSSPPSTYSGTRRERAPYAVGRAASIVSFWTSLPSPSVLSRGPRVLSHSRKSGTGGHFLSEGLSRVLSVTKMWDNRQEPDGRSKTGNGLGAACPNADPHCKGIGSSYRSTRCQKIDGLKHFHKSHSINEGTLQQEAMV